MIGLADLFLFGNGIVIDIDVEEGEERAENFQMFEEEVMEVVLGGFVFGSSDCGHGQGNNGQAR